MNKTGKGRMGLMGLMVLMAAALMAGCTLPVPKTSIAFRPESRTVDIQSPKDVEIGKVSVEWAGTNFNLTVENYKSANSLEVVKAAAEAQASQMAAGQAALEKVISAAAGVK